MHLDHAGNVEQFPNATFLIQQAELNAAFWPDPGYSVYYIAGDFQKLKKFNVVRLNGDLDLFGDGSVRIFRAPGHTPGSQFVATRLKNTGTVILTSDVVYLKENLDKNLIPPIPGTWNPVDMYTSYQRVRMVRDIEKAKIFFAHDAEVFKATKHAPEYYD
jgi:glyoxylase-like metal-dependent hydrolase (beta-lactamase superfamily II)